MKRCSSFKTGDDCNSAKVRYGRLIERKQGDIPIKLPVSSDDT
jgi:hypothetical protein